MWLSDAVTEQDYKVHKAVIRAKRAISTYSKDDLRKKGDMNAAGQVSIQADLVAESVFLKTLESEKLSGILYSEESGTKVFGKDPYNPDESLMLLLDPLDGSQNYIKGLPFGCVSVAYGAYTSNKRLDDLDTAIIANLYDDDIYFATKGGGSFLNNDELDLQEHNNGKAHQPPYQLSYYAYGKKGSNFYMSEQQNYAFRSLGSAAWELAMVSDVRNDAYVDLRNVLKAHDFAAARILIEEANGHFKFLGMKDDDPIILGDFKTGFSVLATNNEYLMNKLLKDFTKYEFI